MKRYLLFRAQVAADLREAFGWHETQVPGLGDQFLEQFFQTLDFISHSAEAPRKVFQNYRRVLLKRFPFAVWYEIGGDKVTILIVWDCRRDPERLAELLAQI